MPLHGLGHALVLTDDLEATRAFYCDVLGLEPGDRPSLPFPGYWLYLGGHPIVHLVQRPAGDVPKVGSGNLDHVGFRGVDLDATRAALARAGLTYREQVVPRDGVVQIFVPDPDGIQVELNFDPA